MKSGVTKEHFIKKLEEVIVLTREGVERLELTSRYEKDDTVIIHFIGGGQHTVNIAADSGSAIIRDVAKHIS